MGGCLLLGNAYRRHVQVATDDLGALPEGHALVAGPAPQRPRRSSFQNQPEQVRRIELVYGGPAVGPIADIGGDALLAGDADQVFSSAGGIGW